MSLERRQLYIMQFCTFHSTMVINHALFGRMVMVICSQDCHLSRALPICGGVNYGLFLMWFLLIVYKLQSLWISQSANYGRNRVSKFKKKENERLRTWPLFRWWWCVAEECQLIVVSTFQAKPPLRYTRNNFAIPIKVAFWLCPSLVFWPTPKNRVF